MLAAGSIAGGVVLQRNSAKLSHRPFLTLGGFALIAAVAQLGWPEPLEWGSAWR